MTQAEAERWNDLDHVRFRRLQNAMFLFGIERVELVEDTLFAYGQVPDEWTDGEPLLDSDKKPTIDALARLFQNLRNRRHGWDNPPRVTLD